MSQASPDPDRQPLVDVQISNDGALVELSDIWQEPDGPLHADYTSPGVLPRMSHRQKRFAVLVHPDRSGGAFYVAYRDIRTRLGAAKLRWDHAAQKVEHIRSYDLETETGVQESLLRARAASANTPGDDTT